MIWKLAWKNLARNKRMNQLIIVQLLVVFVITISMTSTIVSRFHDYIPLRKTLNQQGDYFMYQYAQHPVTQYSYTDHSQLLPYLKGNPVLSAIYSAWGFDMTVNDVAVPFNTVAAFAFDDLWLTATQPLMETGEWLSVQERSDGLIPIVVGKNDAGYAVGSTVTVSIPETETAPASVEQGIVVGVLQDGASLPFPQESDGGLIHCKQMFAPFYSEVEDSIYMLLPARYLQGKPVLQMTSNLMITYPEPVSDEIRHENRLFLSQCGAVRTATTAELQKNSIAYSFAQCKMLLPAIAAIFVLILISGISTNAITAKQELRNQAIYYICGFRWKECARIHVASACISAMGALAISCLGVFLLQGTSLLQRSVIEMGLWQLAACGCIVLFYILIATFIPLQIIWHTPPRQILASN